MEVKKKEVAASGIKLLVEKDGKEIGRAFLFLMHNDLHKEPFGLIEDVFVEKEFRQQGIGTGLVKAAIKEAKENRCYKLLCTSRHSRTQIHQWYQKLGFRNHGLEFRMDFK